MNDGIIKRYEDRGDTVIVHAKALNIVDDESNKAAHTFAIQARNAIKEITKEFAPDIQKAHELHKDLLARKNRLVAPVKEAQRIADLEIGRYFKEQERIRREQEEEDAARIAIEAAEQDDELLGDIQDALIDGDMEKAEELAATTIEISPAIIQQEEKTHRVDAGTTSVRKDIMVVLKDKDAVIKAVYDGDLPDTILDVNLGAAKRYAKAAGKSSMPGFEVTETVVVMGR